MNPRAGLEARLAAVRRDLQHRGHLEARDGSRRPGQFKTRAGSRMRFDPQDIHQGSGRSNDSIALEPRRGSDVEPLRLARNSAAAGPACRVEQVGVRGRGEHERAKNAGVARWGELLERAPHPPPVNDDRRRAAMEFAVCGQQAGFPIGRRGPRAAAVSRAADLDVAAFG